MFVQMKDVQRPLEPPTPLGRLCRTRASANLGLPRGALWGWDLTGSRVLSYSRALNRVLSRAVERIPQNGFKCPTKPKT